MINNLALHDAFVIYLLLALFALAIGSLLNVIIYRLPLMIHADWTGTARTVNLFFPRSFCPYCKKTIPALGNIPLLSYCLQRGRCKNCHHPISWRYPVVESLSCFLALFAAWHFGFNFTLLFALFFIWLLIAIFFIDLEHQLIPDSLSLSLLWLGLIANTQSLFTSLSNAVLSAALAYLALRFFIYLYYVISKKEGMGHGDFKLFAAFGAWFGWQQLPLILLLASVTGAIIGGIYLHRQGKTKETPIAFGPFLCLAGIVSLFWGKSLLDWYLSILFVL